MIGRLCQAGLCALVGLSVGRSRGKLEERDDVNAEEDVESPIGDDFVRPMIQTTQVKCITRDVGRCEYRRMPQTDGVLPLAAT